MIFASCTVLWAASATKQLPRNVSSRGVNLTRGGNLKTEKTEGFIILYIVGQQLPGHF